jgi:hypothetical protein
VAGTENILGATMTEALGVTKCMLWQLFQSFYLCILLYYSPA